MRSHFIAGLSGCWTTDRGERGKSQYITKTQYEQAGKNQVFRYPSISYLHLMLHEELFYISDCCGMSKMRASLIHEGMYLHLATQMISVLHCPPFIVICPLQFLTLTIQKRSCWNEPHCKCAITRRLRNLQVFAILDVLYFQQICKECHTWRQPWHPLLCSMIFPLHMAAEMNYGNPTLYFCCSYAA